MVKVIIQDIEIELDPTELQRHGIEEVDVSKLFKEIKLETSEIKEFADIIIDASIN